MPKIRVPDYSKKISMGVYKTKIVEHEKLKRCPFCGGKAKLLEVAGCYWAISCQSCDAQVHFRKPSEDIRTQKARIGIVVKDWNKRVV